MQIVLCVMCHCFHLSKETCNLELDGCFVVAFFQIYFVLQQKKYFNQNELQSNEHFCK